MKRIAIIGGGASGLVASVTAARLGARVTIYERMQRVGKKLLATGNGRCNLSNRTLDTTHYHGGQPAFVEKIFSQFGLGETLDFFDGLGIGVVEEEAGRLFPMSQQASSVLDVLRYEAEQLGVREECEATIHRVERRRDGLRCTCADGRSFDADAVLVCAGGKSSPNLGSNGGGFKLAETMGHTIVEPFPALVQVTLDADYLNQLAGVGLTGQAGVLVDGDCERSESGELLFAKYGISGSAILGLSRWVSAAAANMHNAQLRLDLFPALGQEELAGVICNRIERAPQKPISFSFVGLVHKRLIPVILRLSGIHEPQRACGELSHEEIARIVQTLKAWTIPCAGTQSWMFSQVTAGGVEVSEVDWDTLESKRMPGVHFAGEVLDIDGDSGGYNLQWAWSTGAIAGTSAARG